MRQAVLFELTASPVPLSAYDITHALTARYGQKRHANSVYRALWGLMATKEVALIASWRKFTVNSTDGASRAWLLCEICNAARSVPMVDSEDALTTLADGSKFKVSQIVLEMRGRCSSCADD